MASSNRKTRHYMQKRRSKYRKVFEKYRKSNEKLYMSRQQILDMLIADLLKLHIKVLQTLLEDIQGNRYIFPLSRDHSRMLEHSISFAIMERTMLK